MMVTNANAPAQPASPASVIRRWIQFADAGFDGDFLQFVSPDYVGHLSTDTHDLAQLIRLEQQFAAAFNVRRSIEDLIVDGEKVVARIRSHATHIGDFYGRPRSNREVSFTAIVIYHVVEGRIRESWGEVDFAGLMRQLP
jgi:predicted ester cyclase